VRVGRWARPGGAVILCPARRGERSSGQSYRKDPSRARTQPTRQGGSGRRAAEHRVPSRSAIYVRQRPDPSSAARDQKIKSQEQGDDPVLRTTSHASCANRRRGPHQPHLGQLRSPIGQPSPRHIGRRPDDCPCAIRHTHDTSSSRRLRWVHLPLVLRRGCVRVQPRRPARPAEHVQPVSQERAVRERIRRRGPGHERLVRAVPDLRPAPCQTTRSVCGGRPTCSIVVTFSSSSRM
jgi:hypothetical protein